MSRRSQMQIRYSAEPAYFSNASHGMTRYASFERRFVPGVVGSDAESAAILSFDAAICGVKCADLQSKQNERREIVMRKSGSDA